MKLIDTNIFIYAAGKSHPYQERCLKILEQIVSSPGSFNISSEILQEILRVYANKKEMSKGIDLVEAIINMFPQVFPVTTADILTSCTLLRKYSGLNARDALHAAIVLNYNLKGIVSYDRHFDRIDGVIRYEP